MWKQRLGDLWPGATLDKRHAPCAERDLHHNKRWKVTAKEANLLPPTQVHMYIQVPQISGGRVAVQVDLPFPSAAFPFFSFFCVLVLLFATLTLFLGYVFFLLSSLPHFPFSLGYLNKIEGGHNKARHFLLLLLSNQVDKRRLLPVASSKAPVTGDRKMAQWVRAFTTM